jgi:hypothetical protein
MCQVGFQSSAAPVAMPQRLCGAVAQTAAAIAQLEGAAALMQQQQLAVTMM